MTTPEQKKLAAKIESILTAKDPKSGDYLYSKTEVRDFIVACIFELGLPVPQELQNCCLQFIQALELSADASDEQIVEHVFAYFEEYPLHPQLVIEFNELGRQALFGDKLQAKAGAEKLRAIATKGKAQETRAPIAEDTLPKGLQVKARRGLSRPSAPPV